MPRRKLAGFEEMGRLFEKFLGFGIEIRVMKKGRRYVYDGDPEFTEEEWEKQGRKWASFPSSRRR